jgi:putative flavoprotein involved in K+ transport
MKCWIVSANKRIARRVSVRRKKTMTRLDVLIIGAGQAGLALGYHLQKTSLRFLLVERHDHIGASWRQRYDSLVLFTPRAYSALPGLALSGAQDGYPGKDEIADYLARYARDFDLPIITGTSIQSLESHNGGYRATTQDGTVIEARAVVLATGAFQTPALPGMSSQLSPEVRQFTAENYKHAGQIPPGTVLVVGDGAAGRDIAHDLQASHTVILATGHARRRLPERILGKSTWWWLDKLGIVRLSGETALGRYIQKADAFPGKGNTLKKLHGQGVRVVPKLIAAQGHAVTFANGVAAEVTTVIWAIGYRDDCAWVKLPEVKDAHGNFVQQQGVGPLPNFYFIGRPWQRSRGSALIMGVGDDAAWMTDHILKDFGGQEQSERKALPRLIGGGAA